MLVNHLMISKTYDNSKSIFPALRLLNSSGDRARISDASVHYKKFLKYCGLKLSIQQSGNFLGIGTLPVRTGPRRPDLHSLGRGCNNG